jgi:hypothetical protein
MTKCSEEKQQEDRDSEVLFYRRLLGKGYRRWYLERTLIKTQLMKESVGRVF